MNARYWLDKINSLSKPPQTFNVLNVCGGHERSITQAGLRSVLPQWLRLVPGPGCPVCVCPEADIALAITIALKETVSLLAFGDMLRVPINSAALHKLLPKHIRSLENAKAAGADIRPVASPLEVKALALENPHTQFVFFAAGFETTMAPVAAMMSEFFSGNLPGNISFLISGRKTWPAVKHLLDDEQSAPIHGLIAPGHVATIMGAKEWQFVANDYQLPTAIAGFDSESLLQAFYCVRYQTEIKKPTLQNCYPRAVKPEGNKLAQSTLEQCFSVNDANWRGIGSIEQSGYQLRAELNNVNAQLKFAGYLDEINEAFARDSMPKSCRCADVVMARILPDQCALYGKSCLPRQALGPCMVSDEGACRIWWSAGLKGSSLQ
ncbi:Hydrogenase maturation protein HypD [Alteromonadaceae bacterium Bs31]|nr:Hydrogenase maturation protein HypD [Alteromonadaceae bacterium Bs31]